MKKWFARIFRKYPKEFMFDSPTLAVVPTPKMLMVENKRRIRLFR